CGAVRCGWEGGDGRERERESERYEEVRRVGPASHSVALALAFHRSTPHTNKNLSESATPGQSVPSIRRPAE
ncbi:hypothetical protein J6590_007919, partial [Homalodisca vitripennis]